MPTSKETRVLVEGFWKIIPSVRPGRRWCGSRRRCCSFSSSASSSTRVRSSPDQSPTRVKLRPFRPSCVATMRIRCYLSGRSDPDARVLAQLLAQACKPGEHAALDRSEWLAKAFRELGLRVAAVVGELDRLALLGRETP